MFDTRFNFDPSGRQFTYTDLGFDDAGEEGPQVFTQGLTSGERRQLTRLPRIAQGEPPALGWPVFIDARTILFGRFTEPPDRITALTVDTVDMHLRDAPTVALPGGAVVPIFHIVGGQWLAVPIRVGAEAVNPVPGQSVKEVFVTDGTNVLQLTDFRRTDTSLFDPFFRPRDQRVYFTASADPLGTNPSHDCQIFSMEPLSRDLRQVTFFHEGGDHWNACSGGRLPNGCRIDFPYLSAQQPLTGTIYFRSTCDPFGLNPNGTQLFSIQPDGTELRQLTNARGFVQGADRAVELETVDQVFKYSPHR